MQRTLGLLLACALLFAALALPVRAEGPARKGFVGFTCEPPRFQVFEAPRPYGGLILLDTQTGESWQRVIINSQAGIQIRWMKLERGGPKTGESIIWQ
ncbi:hypothetical protein AAU61_10115 [Desulfocarbo indianensis]|nr:hypothetical protein AAU61_10115 [Desulfocarbo indianensis]